MPEVGLAKCLCTRVFQQCTMNHYEIMVKLLYSSVQRALLSKNVVFGEVFGQKDRKSVLKTGGKKLPVHRLKFFLPPQVFSRDGLIS